MSQRVFDAFVFDLDGTLVDTASELITAYQKLCIELGGGEKPFEDARKLISHGSGRLVTEGPASRKVILDGSRIASNIWTGMRNYLAQQPSRTMVW